MPRILDNLSEDKKKTYSGYVAHGARERAPQTKTASRSARNYKNFSLMPQQNTLKWHTKKRIKLPSVETYSAGGLTKKSMWGATSQRQRPHLEEMFQNPINAKKIDNYKARKSHKGSGEGKYSTLVPQAKLSTVEALNKVYAKKRSTNRGISNGAD